MKKKSMFTMKWQENFRTSELDYQLLNYALDIDSIYSKNHEVMTARNLVVTCMDQRPGFNFNRDEIKNGDDIRVMECSSPEGKFVDICRYQKS